MANYICLHVWYTIHVKNVIMNSDKMTTVLYLKCEIDNRHTVFIHTDAQCLVPISNF